MKTENTLTGLAGEYAVAAQMALHGWHAAPTIKNFPEVDLVAYNPTTGKRLTIQVKAARRGAWSMGVIEFDGKQWHIEHLYERADIYVLVGLPDDNEPSFSFYVMPTRHLKKILLQYAPAKYSKRKTNEPQPCWVNKHKLDHQAEWQVIAQFKNRWDLLDEVSGLPE